MKKDHSLRFDPARGWVLTFVPTGAISIHYSPLSARAALDAHRKAHQEEQAMTPERKRWRRATCHSCGVVAMCSPGFVYCERCDDAHARQIEAASKLTIRERLFGVTKGKKR